MYDRSMQKWHDIYLNNGCIREHKNRYAYKISKELCNKSCIINHKTVKKLMQILNW